MAKRSKEGHYLMLLIIGLAGWLVPGGGHLMLKKNRHAIIIFVTIAATFGIGLYIGSVGVINPVGAKPWYVAQIMNTPAVAALGQITKAEEYAVYGRPNEIGQIYTSIAGLLNLLCIVNAVYLAHIRGTEAAAT
jgi:hypothetical protein